MIRRRPILHASPKPAHSLRYQTSPDGACRIYPDGREVCNDSVAGWREYKRRVEIMWRRQNFKCCLCGKRLALNQATYDHQRRRGMAAAFRDDRLENGGAAHWICNSEKG